MKTIIWKNSPIQYTVLTECGDVYLIDDNGMEWTGNISTIEDIKTLDKDGERVKIADLPANVYGCIAKLC